MKLIAHAPTLLAAALLTACAAPTSEAVDESSSDLVNKPSNDITVLGASTSGPVGNMQRSECSPLPSGEFDCTKAYETRLGLPLLHEVVLRSPEEVQCSTLRVRTASRSDAISQASATGIGFHYDGYTGKGRFIPKSALVEIGFISLRTGGGARVHEFAGFTTCWLGSGSSSANAKYKFKPYMQFEANGEVFRNWDIVANDYVISSNVPAFDRFNELSFPTPR